VREGFIVQRAGERDRRQRLLELTEKGLELERRLSENQRVRVARAYREAGAHAVEGFRKVMLGIITSDEDRKRFERGGIAISLVADRRRRP
jgi:DNA-binding MarR family transcriptional regulator